MNRTAKKSKCTNLWVLIHKDFTDVSLTLFTTLVPIRRK